MNSFKEDELNYQVRLPTREFMYTVDQICFMLDISKDDAVKKVLWFSGRSVGKPNHRLITVNIAAPDQSPIWRVSETSFRTWMKVKRIQFNDPEVRGRVLRRQRGRG